MTNDEQILLLWQWLEVVSKSAKIVTSNHAEHIRDLKERIELQERDIAMLVAALGVSRSSNHTPSKKSPTIIRLLEHGNNVVSAPRLREGLKP